MGDNQKGLVRRHLPNLHATLSLGTNLKSSLSLNFISSNKKEQDPERAKVPSVSIHPHPCQPTGIPKEICRVRQENLMITLQKQYFISQNRNKTVDLHPQTHRIYTENYLQKLFMNA